MIQHPEKGMLLVSNGGQGPDLARILAIGDTDAKLERWRKGSRRKIPFVLTVAFLRSRQCGWTLGRTDDGR